jgi:xylulokinase
MSGYLLGFDIGSSAIKASLVDIDSGEMISSAGSPETEMTITSRGPGWAEQDPELWWTHMVAAMETISRENGTALQAVRAIGIAYQMHGLVVVDVDGRCLRESIIWCDSRAVSYGRAAFKSLGEELCLKTLLNSPGNFTAAKLAWIKEQEPELFKKIDKMMLPGEYLAYRMTGQAVTTPSGLSEGILWDFQKNCPADLLLRHWGFDRSLLPEVLPSFGDQGRVTARAAAELGVPAGIPVSYRAGDQPNNAFSLNVLRPGELAASAGTSGAIYGIAEKPLYDPLSRVNTFVHVNHGVDGDKYGVLLCLNGTGSFNRWLRQLLEGIVPGAMGYPVMNALASKAPAGADGLLLFPFGNGAERTLENAAPGASIENINFNLHTRNHLLRAAQESIVFALNYGIEIMAEMGISVQTIKTGRANMFLSPLFRQIFAATTGARLEMYNTDGASGAARGAGVGAGIYRSFEEAFTSLTCEEVVEPDPGLTGTYSDLYDSWKTTLLRRLEKDTA